MSAFIALVQVEGQRKTAVGGGGAQIVAVGAKMAPAGCVVAGDLEAFECGRFEGECLLDLGDDAPADRRGELLDEGRVLDRDVSSSFEVGIEDVFAAVR